MSHCEHVAAAACRRRACGARGSGCCERLAVRRDLGSVSRHGRKGGSGAEIVRTEGRRAVVRRAGERGSGRDRPGRGRRWRRGVRDGRGRIPRCARRRAAVRRGRRERKLRGRRDVRRRRRRGRVRSLPQRRSRWSLRWRLRRLRRRRQRHSDVLGVHSAMRGRGHVARVSRDRRGRRRRPGRGRVRAGLVLHGATAEGLRAESPGAAEGTPSQGPIPVRTAAGLVVPGEPANYSYGPGPIKDVTPSQGGAVKPGAGGVLSECDTYEVNNGSILANKFTGSIAGKPGRARSEAPGVGCGCVFPRGTNGWLPGAGGGGGGGYTGGGGGSTGSICSYSVNGGTCYDTGPGMGGGGGASFFAKQANRSPSSTPHPRPAPRSRSRRSSRSTARRRGRSTGRGRRSSRSGSAATIRRSPARARQSPTVSRST